MLASSLKINRLRERWDLARDNRAIAFKSGGKVHLRSRNNKDFDKKYPFIVAALAGMPDETIIDGELVALDGAGRPSFNALQDFASSKHRLSFTSSIS